MWVQVRTMDGKRSEQVDGLSKLTKVEELRKLITEKFGIESNCQRLFFRGKQMENGYKLFDYDVGLNDIIQLLERKVTAAASDSQETDFNDEKVDSSSDTDSGIDTKDNGTETTVLGLSSCSDKCKIGDLVDAQDPATGAWFEATVKAVSLDKNTFSYEIEYDDYSEIKVLSESQIRPRARNLLAWKDINLCDRVMVNYNIDKPSSRGFWYDAIVLEKKMKRTFNELIVELILGHDKTLKPCSVLFVEEVFEIEKFGEETKPFELETTPKRLTVDEPYCSHCNDNLRRKCKECGCHVCGEKKEFNLTLLCDECNLPFHTFCLDPPLDSPPEEEEWYCPLCRNDQSEVVRAGEKLKASKKKAKMKSATGGCERDWGKGMACVGRSKICTIVPPNHKGPVPGIPVGTLWKFRMQVSEAGVHRPHVSGIHGKESDGAYSIVLAGGYEDDEDNGDEFFYTGSGGRDLSGNKRTAEQSSDQVLTKNNMAIARSCFAKVDSKSGAEATEWKKSRPIRVVRNYKGAKHSKYAPKEGNRYDGIYKVVKYWPEKGKSGFIVWRYLFRRDDTEPAPWTNKGKKRIKELGITMQYPDGYLDAKKNATSDEGKNGRKRKSDIRNDVSSPKKAKAASYEIPSSAKKLIKFDVANKKLWDEGLVSSREGQQAFYEKLQTLFSCVCCQDLANQPVTTPCQHNMCKDCLQRSFRAEVYTCPVCRNILGKEYDMVVNENLQKVLSIFFPGYENSR